MYRLASCILLEHDLTLLVVAIVICAAGSLITVRLLQRTFSSSSTARIGWIVVGAIVAGSTVGAWVAAPVSVVREELETGGGCRRQKIGAIK